jgi:hypothetical protein
MGTHDVVSGQNLAVSAERREGARSAGKAEGRQYARPEVHDLGSLELVQATYVGYVTDYRDLYFQGV